MKLILENALVKHTKNEIDLCLELIMLCGVTINVKQKNIEKSDSSSIIEFAKQNYTKGFESLMNNSITQKSKNTKRYLPYEVKTRIYAVEMYRNCGDISYVCRKYHISRTSLWRWNKKYDGIKESITDKSYKPLSKHPTEHTDEEMKWIKDLIRRNSHITLNEIWYKLKINKGYTRRPISLYRVLRKIGYYNKPEVKGTSKKHNKEYHTPKEIGKKWQIDVKYVPNECKSKELPKNKRYYQYTCIDEASRERFLYWYEEHTPANTVDFVNRCI